MNDLLINLPRVLEYFTPESYLDIGANKGHQVSFIRTMMPCIKHIELVEACRYHEWDIQQQHVPYKIEVLSDSVKTVNMYLHDDRSTYYKEDIPYFNTAPFEPRTTTTLDLLYPTETFDLIKIDTEGSELDIIRGGLNLLSRAKAIIVDEDITPYHEGAPSANEIRGFLESIGFVFVKHLRWNAQMVLDSTYHGVYREDADGLYININQIKSVAKLPISAGILAWKSGATLENTLESYRVNGLFDILDDVCILFQESTSDDIALAKKYNLPHIALDNNVGIGRGFVMLCQQARNPHILLLEHDWELVEDFVTTRLRLKSSLDMVLSDTDVVRLRHRRNPGYPLYSQTPYQGRELDHYDPSIDLHSPHLFESIHWIENLNEVFSDKIFVENGHYVTTSRWSNWTNNPCLFRRDFYIELVNWFAAKGTLLEPEISHWWARQQFKIAWGEGLFKHNDIVKHGKNSSQDNTDVNM